MKKQQRLSRERKTTKLWLRMRIERIWNDELKDETSPAYRELASVIENEVQKQYSEVKNFIGVQIVKFRPGSVVAEVKLLFKQKVLDDTAVAPLKKAVENGNLGPLNVNPESLKIMNEYEVPTKDAEGKLPYPLIIGTSCGGIFVLALVSICLVRYCYSLKKPDRRQVSNGMPSEVCRPNPDKYELKEARFKEDIVSYEELGVWKHDGMYEKLHFSNGETRYQEVGLHNMAADYQEIGKPNNAGYNQEIGSEDNPERYVQIDIFKKAGEK